MVSLKTEHLKRYKEVAMLLAKYGRSDLVKQSGLEESLELDEHAIEAAVPKAEELATDLEKLGPTFIKLGQLLSTRADLQSAVNHGVSWMGGALAPTSAKNRCDLRERASSGNNTP